MLKQILRHLSRVPDWVVASISILSIIVALWLPFGLQVTGVGEEWYGRAYFEGESITSQNILAELTTRPTSIWSFRFAYILTPDSFAANNLITIALLWGKGFTLYLILRRLFPDHVLPAFFTGIIFAVYPADISVVSLRVSHYHTNNLFFLMAVYLLLRYWEEPHWYMMAAIWGLLGSAMLMAENTYPLIFLTPFLLLFKERKVTRRWLIVTCLWYLAPSLTFSYSFYMIFIRDVSFQSDTLTTNTLEFYVRILIRVYRVNLTGGWSAAFQELVLDSNIMELGIAGFTTVISLISGWRLLYSDEKYPNLSVKEIFILIVVSLIMIGAAFAVYLPTNRANERLQFRVFLLTSLGAAIFWGYSLYFFTRAAFSKYSHYLYIVSMSFLVTLAVARMLHIHEIYANVAEHQEHFLRQVTGIIPQFEEEAYLIFIPREENQRFSTHNLHFGQVLTAALRYIYEDYSNIQDAVICQPRAILRTECTFNADTVVLHFTDASNNLIRSQIHYDDLLIFEIAPDDTIQLLGSIPQSDRYQPDRIINEFASPPRRINTIFGIPSE